MSLLKTSLNTAMGQVRAQALFTRPEVPAVVVRPRPWPAPSSQPPGPQCLKTQASIQAQCVLWNL